MKICIFAQNRTDMQMKTQHFIIPFLAIFLSCCSNKTFELEANITDLQNDTIYIIHDDPTSKVDTIYVKNSQFNYQTRIDTTTLMRLYTEESNRYIPLIVTQPGKIKLSGTLQSIKLEGKGSCMEFQHYKDSIANNYKEKDLLDKTEEYIRKHPQSYLSAYLIDSYFIQVKEPDYERIDAIINSLSGTIHDCRILTVAQEEIKRNQKNTNYVSYFTCKDRKGKFVGITENKNFTLLNFWASWDKESCILKDSLYAKIPKIKKGTLTVINLSLDNDSKAWESHCKTDTTAWKECCDFKGWTSNAIQQNKITSIPQNILIDNSRKIIQRNVIPQELPGIIDKLIKEKEAQNKKKK